MKVQGTIISELELQDKKYKSKYILTDKYLIKEWKKNPDSERKAISLEYLSPELGKVKSRQKNVKDFLIPGIILIALSMIFFFSKVQQSIPLLSVFLFIVGIILLINMVRFIRIEEWTSFLKKDGTSIFYIRHSDCNPLERKRFEEKVIKAVNEFKI